MQLDLVGEEDVVGWAGEGILVVRSVGVGFGFFDALVGWGGSSGGDNCGGAWWV